MSGPWDEYQNVHEEKGPWGEYQNIPQEPIQDESKESPSYLREAKDFLTEPLKHSFSENVKTFADSSMENLPTLGMMVGGMGGGLPGAFIGGAIGKATQNLAKPPQETHEYLTAPVESGVQGVAQELLGQKLITPALQVAGESIKKSAQALGKSASSLAEKTGVQPALDSGSQVYQSIKNKVGQKAEDFALNATGGTRKQIEGYKPGTGRALLDRSLVRFGDSPKKIGERAGEAMDSHGKAIGSALTALDERGVKVPTKALIEKLDQRIKELAQDESKIQLRSHLQNMRDHLAGQEGDPAHGILPVPGIPDRPISQVEGVKRGFQEDIHNWMDPSISRKGKELQRVYRQAVEEAANQESTSLGEAFKKEKEDYGLLAPVQEAAEKRGIQQNRHPWGGFLDTNAAVGGALVGGKPGAVKAVIGRNVLAPRLSSSAAVSLNQIYKIMSMSPQSLGQYGPLLMEAAKRGPQALANMNHVLSKDEDFQRMVEKAQKENE